ncbi:oligosaccharide flippase family protein [Hansschlegelia sp. KR7-227]|uniref:oligosaccharide flippase family protein n=1 Tax=Hansschlegelia sp. KR7-227 TaxID=3400914 RepID=UPI003BFDC8CF
MTSSHDAGPAKRVLGWVGWAGADAVGRILLLTGSTAVLSRMLSPRDFGITALVLTVVAVMSVFVGTPFEEALAQKRGLRRSHLEAALAASWAVGLALLALSVPAGMALGAAYDEPQMALLLPVASLSMFFSGHTDIATALARRRRRFNDVAFANLAGHAIGVTLALALAFAGAAVWALIAVRLFVMIARAVLLQMRLGAVIRPRWSTPRLKEIGRFAGFSFLDRLADNLTYLAFNNIVGVFYGVTTLGYVNMAMRLIEPIRGAIVAIAHNLAFSFFAGADAARLRDSASTIASRTAFVITPIFVGLAAVAPALLPVVAGPGWEQATKIATCLALGGAIAVPARLIFTALSASGRPEFGLMSSIVGFAATVVALVAAIALGPIAVGLARLVGDGVQAAIAIGLPNRLLSWSRTARLGAFLPAWILAGGMGVAVAVLGAALRSSGDLTSLLISVPLGAVLYVALLALFARDTLTTLAAAVRPHRAEA